MFKNQLAAALVWFRQDLRLDDNPALQAAIDLGLPIIPVYVLPSKEEESHWPMGSASQWWLHHALKDLNEQLQKHGLRLILKQGNTLKILQQLIGELHIQAIFWNRRYEPHIIERDTTIKEILKKENIEIASFNASLLFEPHTISNKSQKPFQVFTPFWKCCLTQNIQKPLKTSFSAIRVPTQWPSSLKLEDFHLLPKIPWDKGFNQFWDPTHAGALTKLKELCQKKVDSYSENRDFPSLDGTSILSPYLHFGQISPRQIWQAVENLTSTKQNPSKSFKSTSSDCFLSEIGWREFAYHLLYHFPRTTTEPLQEKFKKFSWEYNSETLTRWQKGLTGYPIVDSGIRQLWQIGWMHNRVRMIVASFLIKHLQQPWLDGAKWFWDTLVDADLASNTLGWQWSAGCGADAAPYFRIFNPVLQSQKFDPEGLYIKKYIPELSKVPARFIHAPWEATPEALKTWGVELGENYPRPIVEHGFARKRALEAFEKIKLI